MWVVTRMLMVALTGVTVLPHSVWDASAADLTLYRGWAEQIVYQNIFPLADERWQYPPGAGALLVVPRLLGGGLGYNWLFFALVAAADAGVLGLLSPQRHAALRDYVVDRSAVPQRSRSSGAPLGQLVAGYRFGNARRAARALS